MKEILLMIILASLASRLQAAKKIDDPEVAAFAKRLAYGESNKALRRVI